MIERIKQGKLTWIDMVEPTPEEIREIVDECSLPIDIALDWIGPVTRSGALLMGKDLKITMDFPIVKRTDINHPHEIKFIISKNRLITVRYEDMEALHRFKKEFEVLSTLNKSKKTNTGTHLFVALLGLLYESLESKLDYVENKLIDIENGIIMEKEKDMVFEISSVSRRMITFRQTIKSHDDVFRDLKPIFDSLYTKKLSDELQGLHHAHFHLGRRTLALFESLEELRNTNSALLTTKQNEIMKILTIMAFITFPLTLMTSMFGMNTQTTPIIGQEGDFWIILGMMSIATVGFFTYFRYKNWI